MKKIQIKSKIKFIENLPKTLIPFKNKNIMNDINIL